MVTTDQMLTKAKMMSVEMEKMNTSSQERQACMKAEQGLFLFLNPSLLPKADMVRG